MVVKPIRCKTKDTLLLFMDSDNSCHTYVDNKKIYYNLTEFQPYDNDEDYNLLNVKYPYVKNTINPIYILERKSITKKQPIYNINNQRICLDTIFSRNKQRNITNNSFENINGLNANTKKYDFNMLHIDIDQNNISNLMGNDIKNGLKIFTDELYISYCEHPKRENENYTDKVFLVNTKTNDMDHTDTNKKLSHENLSYFKQDQKSIYDINESYVENNISRNLNLETPNKSNFPDNDKCSALNNDDLNNFIAEKNEENLNSTPNKSDIKYTNIEDSSKGLSSNILTFEYKNSGCSGCSSLEDSVNSIKDNHSEVNVDGVYESNNDVNVNNGINTPFACSQMRSEGLIYDENVNSNRNKYKHLTVDQIKETYKPENPNVIYTNDIKLEEYFNKMVETVYKYLTETHNFSTKFASGLVEKGGLTWLYIDGSQYVQFMEPDKTIYTLIFHHLKLNTIHVSVFVQLFNSSKLFYNAVILQGVDYVKSNKEITNKDLYMIKEASKESSRSGNDCDMIQENEET